MFWTGLVKYRLLERVQDERARMVEVVCAKEKEHFTLGIHFA
jgi:hypothetical protein